MVRTLIAAPLLQNVWVHVESCKLDGVALHTRSYQSVGVTLWLDQEQVGQAHGQTWHSG